MSDDDFIEKVEKSHERWTGEQGSPERTLDAFPLYGRAKRIEALEQIDLAVKETSATDGALRRYTQLTALQRDMERLHQLMIRNGK
jgi:hypothetical protein